MLGINMPNLNNKISNKIKVSLLVYQHMLATSLTLPVEMLRAGEAFALSHNKNSKSLSIELVGENLQPIKSRAGINIMADNTPESADIAELIIVPSIWRNPRPVLRKHPKLISWLNNLWAGGSTLIGVGTGNCFLAESGLLNGLPATTHWHYAEQFRRDYPEVDLKPDFFITQSERIYCAASLNSLADIIVHIIHQYYGREAAQHVERNFSHEIRKPYEDQRYLEGGADRHADELIAQIQFWMRTNLSSTLDLNEVAAQFNMSQRSFTRRFKAATGTKATDYWQQVRIESAKDLLSSSNLSIQEISFEVGYSDQGYLTRVFKKHLGQTPKEYRGLVRKKLFS